MYEVKYNSEIIGTFDKEQDSIAVALNLHNLSNKSHNIIVSFQDKEIIIFNQF